MAEHKNRIRKNNKSYKNERRKLLKHIEMFAFYFILFLCSLPQSLKWCFTILNYIARRRQQNGDIKMKMKYQESKNR